MKKFFYVHLLDDYSGSPRVLCDFINSVEEQDCSKTIICGGYSGFLSSLQENKFKIPYRRSRFSIINFFLFFLSQAYLFFLLSGLLIGSKFKGDTSVVFINTMLPFGGALAGYLFAGKVVYYIHETSISPNSFKKFLRVFVDICSDSIICVSQYLKDVELYSGENVDVIYNGLRDDFSTKSQLDLEYKHQNRIVLYAGSLKKYKGIDTFVNLATLLPDFNFVAALNCDEQELFSYFSGRSLSENTRLLIRPDSLLELYQDAFLVVNLSDPDSWVETFGLSLLEGMSNGTPVIAPNVGGPVEIVSTDCGLLCHPSDTDKVVEFIHRLGHDYSIWQTYSNAALRRAKEFSSYRYSQSVREYLFTKNIL